LSCPLSVQQKKKLKIGYGGTGVTPAGPRYVKYQNRITSDFKVPVSPNWLKCKQIDMYCVCAAEHAENEDDEKAEAEAMADIMRQIMCHRKHKEDFVT
jgi:hypothetical protein